MQQAIALWEPLTNEFPDRPSYLENLARANLALGHAWERNQSQGRAYVTRGQELLAELKQRFPGHEIGEGFKIDLNMRSHGVTRLFLMTRPPCGGSKRSVGSNWLPPKPKPVNSRPLRNIRETSWPVCGGWATFWRPWMSVKNNYASA